MTGTFALGSTLDLPQLIFHQSLTPGSFTVSLSASAFVLNVPEPGAALIFAPMLLGLVALRWRIARRAGSMGETQMHDSTSG